LGSGEYFEASLVADKEDHWRQAFAVQRGHFGNLLEAKVDVVNEWIRSKNRSVVKEVSDESGATQILEI
jgi:hypothetical protein